MIKPHLDIAQMSDVAGVAKVLFASVFTARG